MSVFPLFIFHYLIGLCAYKKLWQKTIGFLNAGDKYFQCIVTYSVGCKFWFYLFIFYYPIKDFISD